METGEKEIAAMNYEIYIRRAFKCGYNKHGAHAGYFRILADTLPGYKGKIPQSYDKQLSNVISNLDKATDRFLSKFKLTVEEHQKLLEIKQRLQFANSALSIKEIVKEGINITHRFKEFKST